MTTMVDTQRLITSFVDARQDPSADALQFMTSASVRLSRSPISGGSHRVCHQV